MSKNRIGRKNKNEFKYNNSTSHPNYVFEESATKYSSVGITHSSTTFNKKKKRDETNMPLLHNPDTNDKRPAYVRYGIITDKKQNYSKKSIKRFKFHADDFPSVKSKIRHYKKLRKKSTKKAHKKSK